MNHGIQANSLYDSLKPELIDFQRLIIEMAVIPSAHKSEFFYIKSLVTSEKFANNPERAINLVIDELHYFGKILDKIVEDDDARELYISAGLLDKSVAI